MNRGSSGSDWQTQNSANSNQTNQHVGVKQNQVSPHQSYNTLTIQSPSSVKATSTTAPPAPPVPPPAPRASAMSPINMPRSNVISPPPTSQPRIAQYSGMNLRNTNKSPTPVQLQNQMQQLRGREELGSQLSRQSSRESLPRSNSVMNGRETPVSFR